MHTIPISQDHLTTEDVRDIIALKCIPQYDPPKRFFSDNGPPFSSEALQKFLTCQYINNITSSPHYPKSNGFIERQIEAIKTALDTAKSLGRSLSDLLLSLRSAPIGPYLPPRESYIIGPGQPSHPVDFEEVRDYLITQKSLQKKNHNRRYNAKDLPELHADQSVLFLSPADVKSILRRHHYRTINHTLQLPNRSTRQNIITATDNTSDPCT